MGRPLFTNNASGKLNAGISDTDTTIDLEAGQGGLFPEIAVYDDFFYVTLSDVMDRTEIVKVTARSTDTLTIERAQEGTAARSFSKGDAVELRLTADGIKGLMDTWWIRESATVGDVAGSTDMFWVSGNKTEDYQQYRAVRLWQSTNDTGYVVGSVYEPALGKTLVTVENCTVDSGLVAVEMGGAVDASPKYYGKAASADDADTVGGLSPSEIIPSGLISLWSGSVASVPSGWNLCDGTNGTPDLRDRFVIGAGGSYAVSSAGGAAQHGHTASSESTGAHTHSVTVEGHSLTSSEIPSHNHSFSGSTNATGGHTHTVTDAYVEFGESSLVTGTGGARSATTTRTTSSAGSHSHSFSGNTGNTGSSSSHSHGGSSGSAGGHSHAITVADGPSLPPYYALAYIMKL